jgi:uncharacterized protein (TIRG00374 family)
MSASLRRRLLTGLFLGFIVVLGLALLSDVRQVGEHLASFSWRLLPLILGGTLFNYTLRFVKWHYYLGLIGIRTLPWYHSLQLFIAGFPLAVTPGKVGEALKGVWLNKTCGTPIARGIPVVLAERISDGLAVLALSTLGVIAYPRYWPAFASVLAILLVGVVVSQIRPAALWLLDLTGRLPLIKRFSSSLREFYEGTFLLFRPRATLVAVSLGTIAWLGEGLAMYWVLTGLGISTGIQTAAIAVFVLSFSTVIGADSALPGGLGAAELSITGMLSLLLQLPTSTATAATLIIRFATLWFGVSLGLIVWLGSRDLILLESEPPSTVPPNPSRGINIDETTQR